MADVINTKNLSKHYGSLKAADDISLSVGKGEIYGFLGLNGAGKTTTIRMLLGMIRPTNGASYLNGKKVDPGNYEIFNNVGYMVEVPYSYPELSTIENLELVRKLRGIKDKKVVAGIIEKLKLKQYADVKARHLSLGNAQRLGLAKALIHNPSVLILDEPSNGLDPAGIVEVRELLLDLAQNHGMTIFISSHILNEISKVASRIGIIHNGRLLQEMDSKVLEPLRRKRLLVGSTDNMKALSALNNAGYDVKLTEDGMAEVKGEKAIAHPEEISRILVCAGCPATQLRTEEEDLESYFLRTIQETGGIVK